MRLGYSFLCLWKCSAIYSDNDENGEQHVVLCKVILGASELVAYGSDQFHPSSEDFDTGVDDTVSPRRLVVWSTHMNTHILPLYVVSFRLPPCWHSKFHHSLKLPVCVMCVVSFLPFRFKLFIKPNLCKCSKVKSKGEAFWTCSSGSEPRTLCKQT